MPVNIQQLQNSAEHLHYIGDRLSAEVRLLSSLIHSLDSTTLKLLAQVHLSYGQPCKEYAVGVSKSSLLSDRLALEYAEPSANTFLELINSYPSFPDPLLAYYLFFQLPSVEQSTKRIAILQRLANCLLVQFPCRPDLPYQILSFDNSGVLLRGAPKRLVWPPGWYTNTQPYLAMLGVLWSQGLYEGMWLGMISAQFYGRSFPLSDFHIRALSVLGEASRAFNIFDSLYKLNPEQFALTTLSNNLFMALGMEEIDVATVSRFATHFNRVSASSLPQSPLSPSNQSITVSERPIVAILSSDLRQHPVGRFWLPIARVLQRSFRVVVFAGHPLDEDPIRSELRSLSDEWVPMTPHELENIVSKLHQIAPSILLDLGGHTADNHPKLLCARFAPVQATYLGFYGPTYASCCDWWIIDQALFRRIGTSYPNSEPIWSMPGPSLCYVPSLHQLPPVDQISYKSTQSFTVASFNHTRKLTPACRNRFASILRSNPSLTLLFRSHSFQDPAVRRRFVQQLSDAGVKPHQLLPVPYATSPTQALSDYARVNLHLDSYPVSGTTTTLDSLAMGIPVLTSPNSLYAGAISAAILEQAGLSEFVCEDPDQLPDKALELCHRFQTAGARRDLATYVRNSVLCDEKQMPAMFAEQLKLMLRRLDQGRSDSVQSAQTKKQVF